MNQKLLLVVGAVILVLALGGGFLLLSNNSNQTDNSSAQIQTPTSQPTETQESSPAMEQSEETQVELTSSGFSPKDITIKKGTKVVWTNNSGSTATVDSNPHPIHTSYPEMNLGQFGDGETLEFNFPEAGTFNYHNHLNSSQGGTVTVTE